jgi:hypothetical protein
MIKNTKHSLIPPSFITGAAIFDSLAILFFFLAPVARDEGFLSATKGLSYAGFGLIAIAFATLFAFLKSLPDSSGRYIIVSGVGIALRFGYYLALFKFAEEPTEGQLAVVKGLGTSGTLLALSGLHGIYGRCGFRSVILAIGHFIATMVPLCMLFIASGIPIEALLGSICFGLILQVLSAPACFMYRMRVIARESRENELKLNTDIITP